MIGQTFVADGGSGTSFNPFDGNIFNPSGGTVSSSSSSPSSGGNVQVDVTDAPLSFEDWAKKYSRGPFGELGYTGGSDVMSRAAVQAQYQKYLASHTGTGNTSGSHSGAGASGDAYSTDPSGYDQSQWAFEQQWKMDEAEREFNSAEAAKQRDWEKMMSDTAISRAVADIKAAGLNPWLALNGGSLGAASTPSGASASASSGSSHVPHNYIYQLVASVLSSASSLIKILL